MDAKYYSFAAKAMGDITITIAAPAVLAAVLGRYLDQHFQTGRLLFIILLSVAFVFTIMILPRKIRQYGQAYQKLTN